MKRMLVIDRDRPMRTYRVRDEFDRDKSDIHEWIGACQAWSGLSPIIVDEYEIRSKSGKLSPARFCVRILDWKGPITTDPIDKGELYRVLHDYIRHVAVGTRQNSIKKGLMKLT